MRLWFAQFLLLLCLASVSFSAGACIGATTNFTCGSSVTESCTLNESITSAGTCLTVTANNVTIDCAGYSITGTNSSGNYGVVSTVSNTTVKNCIISNEQFAIYFVGAENGTIMNNTLSSTYLTGIGLYITAGSDNALIENNTMTSSAYVAAETRLSSNMTIRNNSISGKSTTYGALLVYDNSENILISGNSIDANLASRAFAIIAGSPRNITVYNNSFVNARGLIDIQVGQDILIDCNWIPYVGDNGAGFSGIAAAGATNVTIRNCNISNVYRSITLGSGANNCTIENNVVVSNYGTNGAGIGMLTTSDNTVRNNTITSGDYGVYVSGLSYRNMVYNNTIAGTDTAYGTVLINTGASNNTIANNTITANNGGTKGRGITLYSGECADNNITNNSITGFTVAIDINDGDRNVIDCMWNPIVGTGATGEEGINTNGEYTTIQNCNISNVQIGIRLASSNNHLVQNTELHSTHANGNLFVINSVDNSYTDNLTLDTLTGYSFFTTGADNNVINNSRLSGKENTYGTWLFYSNSKNNTIQNTVIDGREGTYAITLQSGDNANNRLINVTIQNSTNGISNTAGSNLSVDCQSTTITGRNVTGTYGGIYSTQFNTTVENCIIGNWRHGIFFQNAGNGTIRNNTIDTTYGTNGYAVYFNNVQNTTISKNTISGREDTYGALLLYFNSKYNIVANNTIDGKGGTYAMTLKTTHQNDGNYIINNTFLNATNLLYLGTGSSENTIYWNNFTHTGMTPSKYIEDLNGNNYYNSSTEGNVWGDIMNGSIEAKGAVSSAGYPALYIATIGAGVPYNITKTSLFSCNFAGCADYHPLTSYLSNTCTAPAINNNWNVNASDNCNITNQNINLGTGGFYYYGEGNITFLNTTMNASTSRKNDTLWSGIIDIHIQNPCTFRWYG